MHHFESFETSAEDRAARQARFGDRSSMVADEAFPLFPFRADARMTGIATFDIAADGTTATGFIPAMIMADGSTEPLRPDDPRSRTSSGTSSGSHVRAASTHGSSARNATDGCCST